MYKIKRFKSFIQPLTEEVLFKEIEELFLPWYLEEKRRNPELNPKIDIIRALERRQDDPDIYISFVEDVGVPDGAVSGFKIGINPKSRYNTPTGIYTYPLKQAFAEYANGGYLEA